jgi:HK97 family phage portal protein
MIISNLAGDQAVPVQVNPGEQRPRVYAGGWSKTVSGQRIDEESAKKIATAYLCAALIVDDIGMMPLQHYKRTPSGPVRMQPDATTRNLAYRLEMEPNRWMSPFLWKRTIANWLIWWGNAYIWTPPGPSREMFILDASKTYPTFDQDGNKWYRTTWPNQDQDDIPDVEMAHLMLNSRNGWVGISILEYAKETFGRQLAHHITQDSISGNGLQPSALLWVKSNKTLSQENRNLVKKSYLDAVGSGVAVLETDQFEKFEPITMKPSDAQFLETVQATDVDIANFFKVPLHKLNMGKQSYESNEQQELNYLHSALNPHLIQFEQVGRLKWIDSASQSKQYLKWTRDSLLQTDAKTRSEVLRNRVQSGMMTPNEARQIEDMARFDGGDAFYMPANMGKIMADGAIDAGLAGKSKEGAV